MARLGPRAKPSSESVKTSKFGLWPNDRVGETIANPSNTLSLESGVKNLEKSKSKIDTSVKINVRRKVLADISNAKGSFLKNALVPEDTVSAGIRKASCSSEKFSRGKVTQASGENHILKRLNKNMKATSDEQVTKVQGRSSMITTGRKSLPVLKQVNKMETSDLKKGKMRLNQIQASGENHILKRQVHKNMKATSDERGTRVQGRVSMTTTGRKSVRNPLPPTRQSLPVLKKINMEKSDTKKENSEKSEKFSVKHGFPVKPRVSRTAVTLPSNSSSRPRRNRVSYDFVVMTSRAQSKVGTGVLSRKSAKSTVKIASAVSTTQRNSKSKCTLGTNKLMSDAAISSKRKQDMAKPSLSAETSSVVSSEKPSQKEVLSGSNNNVDSTRLDVIARRKSDRRNSFTFSLMSGSKFPKQHGKTLENLPNIYDVRNHLEVSDYVDDIYQYYWVMEGQNPLLKDYMEIQTDINPQMRGILVNWLIEVHHKFDLMQETLFLMVTLLDRYLSLEIIKKNEMQLVGLTALLLASKYEDFWHPRVTDLISITAESYTRDLMLGMEKAILKKLKFRLNEPTLYVFMLRFLKAAQSEVKFEHLAFYLIELCLVEYEALNYKPSMLCASAIYLARCTMKMTPTWTPLLEKHTRYEEPQLRNCTEMIMKFHKAARTSMLKVSYEKYMKHDHYKVAAIKPLDILPL
ncbi:cyclin-B3-1 isoform X2 [Olea europaea subsp. europaea]|uniref:Cyclin-B3-1 isoform X2 n=1 Tax=Olea europaea subsp. europaea TaxID=158383 RepID=A0A8S0TY81_OLEEU|nr:cyclin-B3-1 isoform X2 [Olea europaea subsp. europaea]